MSHQAEQIKALARGRWLEILASLGRLNPNDLHSRHHSCPLCGGNKRFRFDDKDGHGTYYCNDCGGPNGTGGAGDGFAMLMRATGWDFNNAVNAVGEWLNSPDPVNDNRPRKSVPPPPVKERENFWLPIIPIPDDVLDLFKAEWINVWNPKPEKEDDPDYQGSNLKPELVTIVRNVEGEAVGAVLRCVITDRVKKTNKKWTPQVVYATDTRTGEERLVLQAIPSPKPLVGCEKVGQKTTVIIVEGEKTRDAAERLLTWPALSWVGGFKSVNTADWKTIEGKKVVIWPDADLEGWTAAQEVANKLRAYSCQVRIVRPPENAVKGWDLADAEEEGWSKADVQAFVKLHMEEPGHPWKIIETTDEQPPATPAEVSESTEVAETEEDEQGYPENHYLRRPGMFAEDWLEVTGRANKPKNTIENCMCLLKHHGIRAKYNIVKKSVEVVIPGETFTVDNAQNATISHLRSIANRNNFPVGELEGYVKAIAERNAYNPVANWIESAEWDRTDYLSELLATIKSPNETLKNLLITRWLVSAIAALYKEPPFTSHGILVFQGAQGLGKTTWVSRLMPDMLSSQFIRTGMTLDPADKDHVVGAITNWIVELGELGSTLRRDVDRIKAFCTNSYDRVRRPYDRMESEYARKTVFFASVNESNFLKDDTGNRRFWVVETSEIDYMHQINMQQLWAQILWMWRSGVPHYLNRDEQATLEVSNSDYMEHDPIEEQIETRLDWTSHQSNWRRCSATQLLLDLKVHNPTRGQATQVAKYLRKKGLATHKSSGGRYFIAPPLNGMDKQGFADDTVVAPFWHDSL